MESVLVRFLTRVPERDTQVDGVLLMTAERDEATDTYLGFMPALKLYSQGRTPQEAQRLMEKATALYVETAVRDGQFSDILLERGFRRISGGSGERPVEIIAVRSISGRPKSAGSDASGMELEFSGSH